METVRVRSRKVRINTVGEFGPWTATIVKERHMIEYNLDTEHSILHVQPKSAIRDFVLKWAHLGRGRPRPLRHREIIEAERRAFEAHVAEIQAEQQRLDGSRNP